VTPTTLRTVAADLADQIELITPDYPLFRNERWEAVEKVREVPGGKLRLYHCEWIPEGPIEDGIFGDAIEYGATLRVWTNYRGLPEVDGESQDVVAEIIDADGRQLWIRLVERVDPVLSGFVSIVPDAVPFTFANEEPGNQWGSHDFKVRYLVSHQ
jgi:hypothetical protein